MFDAVEVQLFLQDVDIARKMRDKFWNKLGEICDDVLNEGDMEGSLLI